MEEQQMLDDVAILAFKRPRELAALLSAIGAYGAKRVTIFQDYDPVLSDEWKSSTELIVSFCRNRSEHEYILANIPLGPHDAIHRLLEACRVRGYNYFTFFEEDVLPSKVLLDAFCAFQSIPVSNLLSEGICSISGNSSCLRASSRERDGVRLMKTKYFSVWGSCTLMSTISGYLRCTLPPAEKLKSFTRGILTREELRTLSLHSLRPWFIYDYQFTMMLVESDMYQVIPTTSWLSHVGHGGSSTHFKSTEAVNIQDEERRLAAVRLDRNTVLLMEELQRIEDDRQGPDDGKSFWGYQRINFMYRMMRICAGLLFSAWKEL